MVQSGINANKSYCRCFFNTLVLWPDSSALLTKIVRAKVPNHDWFACSNHWIFLKSSLPFGDVCVILSPSLYFTLKPPPKSSALVLEIDWRFWTVHQPFSGKHQCQYWLSECGCANSECWCCISFTIVKIWGSCSMEIPNFIAEKYSVDF